MKGEAAVSARALERETRLDALLEVRSLDLGKLPRALVDPGLALGGILNVEVRADTVKLLEGAAKEPWVILLSL